MSLPARSPAAQPGFSGSLPPAGQLRRAIPRSPRLRRREGPPQISGASGPGRGAGRMAPPGLRAALETQAGPAAEAPERSAGTAAPLCGAVNSERGLCAAGEEAAAATGRLAVTCSLIEPAEDSPAAPAPVGEKRSSSPASGALARC